MFSGLTSGRDPYRDYQDGSITQPVSDFSVKRADQERRRLAAIEEKLAQLERRMVKGQFARVRHRLPGTIALVEQAQGLP